MNVLVLICSATLLIASAAVLRQVIELHRDVKRFRRLEATVRRLAVLDDESGQDQARQDLASWLDEQWRADDPQGYPVKWVKASDSTTVRIPVIRDSGTTQ